MQKKKRSKKEEREDAKKARLASIAERKKPSVIDVEEEPEITTEDLKEIAQRVEETAIATPELKMDERVIRHEKDELQKEIESFSNPTILEMPEYFLDPERDLERKVTMGKLSYLLKHRFSLVTIADILETNDYDRLDDIIKRKEELYQAVERYTREDNGKGIKLFSGVKKVVGDEYSKIYSEQEERMRAAINIITEGKYFKKGLKPEGIVLAIEDIVASVIDHPDFSVACQVETEFVTYETDRVAQILDNLHSRMELQDLIEELKIISTKTKERAYAYNVMNQLMTGKERKIVKEKGER